MIQILNILKPIVAEILEVEEESVTPAAKFEDLGADELDLWEICMAAEGEFDVTIETEDGKKIESVGDLIALIEERSHD